MGTLIRNPITYTFAAIGAILLAISLFIGVAPSQTLQLIFVPYTYDITHGVGATGARIFSVGLGIGQLALIMLTAFGVKLDSVVTRRVVWGVGVVLVITYLVIMVLGFLINNFH